MTASFGGARVSERVRRLSSDPLPPSSAGPGLLAAESHPLSAPAVCQAPGSDTKDVVNQDRAPSPKHVTAQWVAR